MDHQQGRDLYAKGRFAEAEPLFRQAAQDQDTAQGADGNDRCSTYWLARTLVRIEKNAEAEPLLRELLRRREISLGAAHVDTLKVKASLAAAVIYQEKYTEAEQIWLQLLSQQYSVLGPDHKDSLTSRSFLARSLYHQERYTDATECVERLISQQERLFGVGHPETIESKLLQQKIAHARAPSSSKNAVNLFDFRLLRDIVAQGKRRGRYSESEVQQISLLLNQFNGQWCTVPRTYIILRAIDRVELLDEFISQGFTDQWLPIAKKGIPSILRRHKHAEFEIAQRRVLTSPEDVAAGNCQHLHAQTLKSLPFEIKAKIAEGAYGRVNKVRWGNDVYAVKKVTRPNTFHINEVSRFTLIIEEIRILRQLRHRHVVDIFWTYTHPGHIGLLMPLANVDLYGYLIRAKDHDHWQLRTFFGCLAKGLEFLHGQFIRHRDIKSNNILVHHGTVMYADFGAALDFAGRGSSTTHNHPVGTPVYWAPENARNGPRNTASDIWSLGVVYLEMAAVLKSKHPNYVFQALPEYGTRQPNPHENIRGVRTLMEVLERRGDANDNEALKWAREMLQMWPEDRPTAAELTQSIIAYGAFCGDCCVSADDSVDDSSDDVDE
jgi:serine/threonine protein kinase